MNGIKIGKGKLGGKGTYATRNFETGELVMHYKLQKLTAKQFLKLPKTERKFVHSFWGQMYLFPEPARYTNHDANPNTRSDIRKMCDYALREIKRGEMITTNATEEVKNELKTFIEAMEGHEIHDFEQIKGGYRNATCVYRVKKSRKQLRLKRIDGNWKLL